MSAFARSALRPFRLPQAMRPQVEAEWDGEDFEPEAAIGVTGMTSSQQLLSSVSHAAAIRGMDVVEGKLPPMPSAQGLFAARAKTKGAINTFFADVDARWDARAKGQDVGKPLMVVLKTDTGVGKNKIVNDKLVERAQNPRPVWLVPEDGPSTEAGWATLPTVVAGPSWALEGEQVQRLRAVGGEDLAIGFLEGKTRAGELHNALLREGEELIEAGCHRPDAMRDLIGAGIPSGRLCRAVDRVKNADGTVETVVTECPHMASCEAQKQRRKYNTDPLRRGVYVDGKLDRSLVDEAQAAEWEPILLTVHAMGSRKSLPRLASKPYAAVIDENILKQMENDAVFPASILHTIIRQAPAPTKAEREAGVIGEELLADYNRIATLAFRGLTLAALNADSYQCPVETMVSEAQEGGVTMDAALKAYAAEPNQETSLGVIEAKAAWNKTVDALIAGAKLAKRVSWGSTMASQAFGPNSSDAEIARVCKTPRAKWGTQEHRFWSLVLERLQGLKDGIDFPREETRISLHNGDVWLAWRSEFAWPNTDTLLLDASASEEALKAMYPTHEVVFVDATLESCGGSLPQHTVWVAGASCSTSKLIPGPAATTEEQMKAAEMVLNLKSCLDAMVTMHPGQQVLIASTMGVEREVVGKWVAGGTLTAAHSVFGLPELENGYAKLDERVATGHYGNLRGKDGFKQVGAVACVGQMNVPEDVIQRRAICYSYDKPRQTFVDKAGNTYINDVRPARSKPEEAMRKGPEKRNLLRRAGGHFRTDVWTHRNCWERLVQLQMREEEIVQAGGRARAALRNSEDPASWPSVYVIGNCPPDSGGWVYDDVIHVKDFRRHADLVQAAVLNGGALWPEAIADLGLVTGLKGASVSAKQQAGSKWLRKSGLGRELPTPLGWAKVALEHGRGQPIVVHVPLQCVGEGQTAEEVAARAWRARTGQPLVGVRLLDSNDIQWSAPVVNNRADWEDRVEAVVEAMNVAAAEMATMVDQGKATASPQLHQKLVERILLTGAVLVPDLPGTTNLPPPEPEIEWIEWGDLKA